MKIVEIIATVTTLIGLYFISEGMAIGFVISMFSNLAWIFYGHEEKQTGILIVNAIIMFINLNGLGVL